MASNKPVIHGRDHLPGHADEITGLADLLANPVLPQTRVTATTDQPIFGGSDDEGGGGINFRAFAWTIGGGDIGQNDLAAIVGSSTTPFTLTDDRIELGVAGTFLAHATVSATFPAQALPRTARVWWPGETVAPVYLPGASKRYMAMGNSTDIVEQFSQAFMFGSAAPGRAVQIYFLEDDASSTRDGTTLSSARQLDLVVLKIGSS